MTTLNDTSWDPGSNQSKGVQQTLRDSIQRVRRRLFLRSVLRWFGCAAGVLAIGIALDISAHLGPALRWMLLGVLVWTCVWFYRHWISRARNICPGPSDMALNLSDTAPLASLAAVADLPKPKTTDPIEQALLEAIETRSSRHIYKDSARASLRTGPMYEMIAITLGLMFLVLASVDRPTLITIGARRIVTPWTQVQWPKRFGISVPESQHPHPSDRAFVVGASIGPSSDNPGAQLRWRLIDHNQQPIIGWTRLGLNKQNSADESGQRYEQLIPIHTLSPKTIPDGTTLEYRIQTRDDRSNIHSVSIVHPPKLKRVTAQVSLPEYATGLGATGTRFSQGQLVMSPAELSLGPVLAGSTIEMRWEFDSPVHAQGGNADGSSFIQDSLTLTESTTATTIPVDEHGLSPRVPMDVFVRVVADAPPDAIIATPSNDLVVGRRAVIEIAGHATDDLGLDRASITGIQRDSSSGESFVLTTSDPDRARDLSMPARLELANIEIEPGQHIELRALVTDILGQKSRSPPRTVRVVEDKEIIDRVESQLGSIGEILRRLDDRQRELLEHSRTGSEVDANDQSTLTDQINARSQAAQSLVNQLAQSRIQDPQLSPMLEALKDSLAEAQKQSERATESLEREQDQQAQEQMEDVRKELGSTIAMLDRGQDTWLARRSIEELRSKVESLLDDTKELSAQTGGKSLEQLSEDQRSMLQKILDKQRQVAKDARETIDELDERADALDDKNPTGAQGIRDAATQGRNSGVEEQLEQAGEEISQNQTSSAAATQQQVLEELDKMLEQIEQAQKNRDSALRRKLASIMDSIKAIIEDQQRELARLDQNQSPLDAAMITLRTNTLSVRDEASDAFQETQTIAESLTSATDAQSEAITALRSDPADLESTRMSELAAITHLQAALDEAKRQDEMAADRQAQQLREELRNQYQEALKEQANITTETGPLVGQDLNRRQRATARQLGGQEDALRETLATMLRETEELSDALIFALAHDQLELLLQSVSDQLGEGLLDPMITQDQQSVATILTALIEVLGDSQQNQSEDFEDGQTGGGGGQGGGGGEEPVIPPIAQLQLLRTLQQLTATQTRAIGESDAPDPQRIRQIGQLQRDLAEKGQQLIEEMNQDPPNNEQPIEQPPEEPKP